MALSNLQAYSDELAAMVAQVAKSVVRVEARQRVAGTGIVWTSEGAIITADHVVERDENIRVVIDGTTHEAELAGRDPTTDLALLKIKATNLIPAQVAGSMTVNGARSSSGSNKVPCAMSRSSDAASPADTEPT